MTKIKAIEREIEEIIEALPSLYGKTLYLKQQRLASLYRVLADLVKQKADAELHKALRHGHH